MPKIVDHELRRAAIVEAYLDVLSTNGTTGTTSKTVAHRIGMVPGSLWHYFDSMDQIAEAAARLGVRRTLDRITARTDGVRGLAALVRIADEVLPLDDVTRNEARVVVAFWGRVTPAGDARGALGRVREFRTLTRTALEEAVQAGELVEATPVSLLVRLLDSVYAGEQVILAADDEASPAAEIRAVFALAVTPWLEGAAQHEAGATIAAWASGR